MQGPTSQRRRSFHRLFIEVLTYLTYLR